MSPLRLKMGDKIISLVASKNFRQVGEERESSHIILSTKSA